MKIAVFHNLPHGGGKRTLNEQIKFLSKNHKLYLYQIKKPVKNNFKHKRYFRDVFNYKFCLTNGRGVNRLFRDFQTFVSLRLLHKKIAEDINNSDCDVVLVHADRFTQTPFVLRYLKKPSLYFCQEYLRLVYEKELAFSDNVPFYKKLYEEATRKERRYIDQVNALYPSKILVNSAYTQKNIKKVYEKDSLVCHPGVDTKVFRKTGNTKKNQVLFVGERNKISGYGFVKETLSLTPWKLRPKLVVLGALKKKLKVKSDFQMAKFYSESVLTVCASHNEPFGLVPLESMACETSIVAVNEGGYKETIVDKKTGYLLPRKANEFAHKIVYLLKNPSVAKTMGREGKKHVLKNFTWEKHCKLIERNLEEISK